MKPRLDTLPAFAKEAVHVIIETPKGSHNKFDYDHKFGAFKLAKVLPTGMIFPFDFGFIPHTKGGDGDPLDVLVIMDQATYPGCLIECRMLGVVRAIQKEKGGKEEENDRFIAVPTCSILYKDITGIRELNRNMVEQIENFFIDYNKHCGKLFKPKAWLDGKKAMHLIHKAKR